MDFLHKNMAESTLNQTLEKREKTTTSMQFIEYDDTNDNNEEHESYVGALHDEHDSENEETAVSDKCAVTEKRQNLSINLTTHKNETSMLVTGCLLNLDSNCVKESNQTVASLEQYQMSYEHEDIEIDTWDLNESGLLCGGDPESALDIDSSNDPLFAESFSPAQIQTHASTKKIGSVIKCNEKKLCHPKHKYDQVIYEPNLTLDLDVASSDIDVLQN